MTFLSPGDGHPVIGQTGQHQNMDIKCQRGTRELWIVILRQFYAHFLLTFLPSVCLDISILFVSVWYRSSVAVNQWPASVCKQKIDPWSFWHVSVPIWESSAVLLAWSAAGAAVLSCVLLTLHSRLLTLTVNHNTTSKSFSRPSVHSYTLSVTYQRHEEFTHCKL